MWVRGDKLVSAIQCAQIVRNLSCKTTLHRFVFLDRVYTIVYYMVFQLIEYFKLPDIYISSVACFCLRCEMSSRG